MCIATALKLAGTDDDDDDDEDEEKNEQHLPVEDC